MKKLKPKTVQEISAYVCDRCGREAEMGDPEAGEFTSIEFVGGYQSIFGDGACVSADICQHCLKETLGKWIKVSDTLTEITSDRYKAEAFLKRAGILTSNGELAPPYRKD